jgi:hypothetical protein
MNERAERAVKTLVLETKESKVSAELDYYFNEIDPKPGMKFVETYQTLSDTTGGWGAEYHPTHPVETGQPRWVIHVHRGKNGGITWAKVKLWNERKDQQKGSVVLNYDNLAALGIAKVDTTKTHT